MHYIGTKDINIVIRQAIPDDASKIIELNKKLATETKYMLRELEEINLDVSKEKERISKAVESDDNLLLIAQAGDSIVGVLGFFRNNRKRIKHVGAFAVGVEKKYWGKGIATALINEMEAWIKDKGIKRIEMTVVENNERAISLYKKLGYEIEGVKRKDHFIGNNTYLNSVCMAKLF